MRLHCSAQHHLENNVNTASSSLEALMSFTQRMNVKYLLDKPW